MIDIKEFKYTPSGKPPVKKPFNGGNKIYVSSKVVDALIQAK